MPRIKITTELVEKAELQIKEFQRQIEYDMLKRPRAAPTKLTSGFFIATTRTTMRIASLNKKFITVIIEAFFSLP